MTRTAVGLACDPACKWRGMTVDLFATKTLFEEAVSTVPSTTLDVITGARVQLVEERYAGMDKLGDIAARCVRSCAVEDCVDLSPVSDWGTEVEIKINEVRGSNG